MSKESAADRHKQDRERIEQAVRELATSDGWTRWIETRQQFHDYSAGNCFLIASQAPDATRVAGFKTWQKLGRQVRKGEKAIRILAPCPVKEKGENGEPTGKVFTLFRSVCVFDIAQTDGEELPELPREPIEGDSLVKHLPALEAHALTLGYTVEYEAIHGEVRGYCDPIGKRIVVDRESRAGNSAVRTLIHEIAHAHGIGYTEYDRASAEVMVESAALIVCGSLGLDTSGESIPYIAGWGSGDVKALRQYAETVDAIARKIEGAVA